MWYYSEKNILNLNKYLFEYWNLLTVKKYLFNLFNKKKKW